jgi:atypical dual specificity phosphatase
MPPPHGFTWVEKPHLAAMARPDSRDDLAWLRQQGLPVLLSLTETPVRRDWVNDAGLFAVHVPVIDMTAPTPEQFDQCLDAIRRANRAGMGVAVHCGAGLGRTGSILAVYFVAKGMPPRAAIAKVRELRPGSVETESQELAIEEFARSRNFGG